MVWNSNWPDGSKSVKQNKNPGLQNTNYIETEMNKDHFWNTGVDEDGHHRAVQMENYADTGVGAPTDPVLSAGMDLAIYSRLINSSNQPFARNVDSIMQILGIRAYAVFNNAAGNIAQTLISSFNVTSVVRQTTGRFEINFTTAFPNTNYLILGGGIGQTTGLSTPCTFSAASNAGTLGNKTTSQCIFLLYEGVSSLNDLIQQGWIVCFGG